MPRSRAATAGTAPVMPAAHTGSAGGASAHASACARSSAACRAAGFISPRSASHAGQARVTMSRNRSVTCQCSA